MKGKVLLGLAFIVMIFLIGMLPSVNADSPPNVVLNGQVQVFPQTTVQGCSSGNLSQGQCGVATTNQITVSVPLKNIGGAMTTPWLIELEPNPVGTFLGYQSVFVSSQSVCNPNTPQNVHKTYMLGAGESTTIALTSTVTVTSNLPSYNRFFVNLYSATGCCNSANGCNAVAAPYSLSPTTVGDVALANPATTTYNCSLSNPLSCGAASNYQAPRCGDGVCNYGVGGENSQNCPQDCAGVVICGDGYCDSAHGETAANCPSDCNPPINTNVQPVLYTNCSQGMIYDNVSKQCIGCPAPNLFPDPVYKNVCCPSGYSADPTTANTSKSLCIPINSAEAGSGQSPSFTYDVWQNSYYTARLKARCQTTNDCTPYSDPANPSVKYSVNCLSTPQIAATLQSDAAQFCKDNPTAANSIVGFLKGGLTGCVTGGTVGAVAGVFAAGFGAVPGAIGGCIIGGTGAAFVGSGATWFGTVDCGTQKLSGPLGACIATSSDQFSNFYNWFFQNQSFLGIQMPGIVVAIMIIILVFVVISLFQK